MIGLAFMSLERKECPWWRVLQPTSQAKKWCRAHRYVYATVLLLKAPIRSVLNIPGCKG